MTTELLAPETPAELIPLAELESINATDAGLALLRAEAAELSSRGVPTTKADYDHVHRATMVAVKVRTETGKLAKKAAQPHKDAYDAIIGEGKRIGSHAMESENLIRPLKEAYEEQQEAERKAREVAEAARFAGRTQTIIDLGMNWTGTAYTFAEHVIEGVDVRGASDEEWDSMLLPVVETVEADRLAIATRRQEQLDREQAERDRLKKQKEDQDAERLELQEQRAEMDRAQAKLRDDQRKVEEKQQAIADEAKRIADEAQAEADRVAAEAAAVEQARLDAIEAKRIVAEQKTAAAARLKADKERAKRLKPDKERLKAWVLSVANYENPRFGLEQVEADTMAENFLHRLMLLATEFGNELDAL